MGCRMINASTGTGVGVPFLRVLMGETYHYGVHLQSFFWGSLWVRFIMRGDFAVWSSQLVCRIRVPSFILVPQHTVSRTIVCSPKAYQVPAAFGRPFFGKVLPSRT